MPPTRLSCLLLLLSRASCRTWRGGLVEGHQIDWKFVANFAFSKAGHQEPGTVRLRAWTFMSGQRLLIYHDEAWLDAYQDQIDLTCEQRSALAAGSINVTKGSVYGKGQQLLTLNVMHSEPAFWFLALSRCLSWSSENNDDACTGGLNDGSTSQNGIFMYYELTMMNPGGYWRAHFSAEEHGLYELAIGFGLLHSMQFIYIVVEIIFHWDNEPLQAKLRLFAAIALCSITAHGFSCAHYERYALTGIEMQWAVLAAEIAKSMGTVSLTMTFLLLSKGWMTSRTSLKRRTRILQSLISLLLIVLSAIGLVAEWTVRDPAATYHQSESSTARILSALRCLITIWFLWCVQHTMAGAPPSASYFFTPLTIIGLVWLLSLPVYSTVVSALPVVTQHAAMALLTSTTDLVTLACLAQYSLRNHASAKPLAVTCAVDAPSPWLRSLRPVASRIQPSPEIPPQKEVTSTLPSKTSCGGAVCVAAARNAQVSHPSHCASSKRSPPDELQPHSLHSPRMSSEVSPTSSRGSQQQSMLLRAALQNSPELAKRNLHVAPNVHYMPEQAKYMPGRSATYALAGDARSASDGSNERLGECEAPLDDNGLMTASSQALKSPSDMHGLVAMTPLPFQGRKVCSASGSRSKRIHVPEGTSESHLGPQ